MFNVLVAIVLVGSLGTAAAEPYEVVHFQSGKTTLAGELFKPKGAGPFPAVLYNHGSAEGMLSDAASTAMGPRYVAKGWVYFMPYRRGQGLSAAAGPYIGDETAKAEKAGGNSAAADTMVRLLTTDHLDDQLAALDWLKSQPFVDASRIAVAGQSFGGIETVLGAEKYPYCAPVDASGAAMSDFDLDPSRVLYKEMIAAKKFAAMKIYPPFRKTAFDGHSFTWLGSAIWFDDVFAFIQDHCAKTAAPIR